MQDFYFTRKSWIFDHLSKGMLCVEIRWRTENTTFWCGWTTTCPCVALFIEYSLPSSTSFFPPHTFVLLTFDFCTLLHGVVLLFLIWALTLILSWSVYLTLIPFAPYNFLSTLRHMTEGLSSLILSPILTADGIHVESLFPLPNWSRQHPPYSLLLAIPCNVASFQYEEIASLSLERQMGATREETYPLTFLYIPL